MAAVNIFAASNEAFEPKHCTGVYVGKNLTADGGVLLGQLGDENSSHWIEVIPRLSWESESVLLVGAEKTEAMEGLRVADTLAESLETRTKLRFKIRPLPRIQKDSHYPCAQPEVARAANELPTCKPCRPQIKTRPCFSKAIFRS